MAMERDDRPWGYYEVVDEGAGYRVKRIVVRPGQRLSYRRHTARSEHWYVVSGLGIVTLDAGPGGSPTRSTSRPAQRTASATPADADVVFIEVQTGSYFGEDDIDRIADDYGRAGSDDVPQRNAGAR